jgi:hypothetical protein
MWNQGWSNPVLHKERFEKIKTPRVASQILEKVLYFIG